MNKIITAFMCMMGLAAFAGDENAPTNAPAEKFDKCVRRDDALERLFREEGLNFEFVEAEHVYKLCFETENGRSQTVVVSAECERVDDYEVREIASFAYDGPITKAQTMYLLNQNYKIGSWRIENRRVIFDCKVASDIMSNDLDTVLRMVAAWADNLEYEWTDDDKY